MSEHTPGPWSVARPSMGFSAIYGPSGELVFGLAAGGIEEKQPDNVCDANARLIAASPMLYAALEKICAGPITVAADANTVSAIGDLMELFREIGAPALARARGEDR